MKRNPMNLSRNRTDIELDSKMTPRPNRVVIWAILVGIFLPYTIAIFIGDLKFTPGKLAALIFLLPAAGTFINQLSQGKRRLIASDVFALGTSLWMVVVPVATAGTEVLVPSVSLVIEFFGMYIIARAYFFGEAALQEFVRALKIILVIIVCCAILDTLTGRFFISETMAQIFGTPDARSIRGNDHFQREIFGFYVIRASSTLDHPILLGAFCAIVASVILYAERKVFSRIGYLFVCVFGCLLSVSSAPLLGMLIAVFVRCYHWLLPQATWRWKALLAVFVLLLGAVFVLSRDPVGWLISHLTLDEQTGYYRLLIWDAAFARIDDHPWLGNLLGGSDDPILNNSVDSVWLVGALGFGIPWVILLLLTNLGALSSVERQAKPASDLSTRLSTGMSLVIFLFLFIGLTVHFWNAMWLFWGLCIGIRASLSEHSKLRAQTTLKSRRSQFAMSSLGATRLPLNAASRFGSSPG
jgi:hypothetical protein